MHQGAIQFESKINLLYGIPPLPEYFHDPLSICRISLSADEEDTGYTVKFRWFSVTTNLMIILNYSSPDY